MKLNDQYCILYRSRYVIDWVTALSSCMKRKAHLEDFGTMSA